MVLYVVRLSHDSNKYIVIEVLLILSSYEDYATNLIESLGYKNLNTQHKIEKALTVYKFLNYLTLEYLRADARKYRAKSKFRGHNENFFFAHICCIGR